MLFAGLSASMAYAQCMPSRVKVRPTPQKDRTTYIVIKDKDNRSRTYTSRSDRRASSYYRPRQQQVRVITTSQPRKRKRTRELLTLQLSVGPNYTGGTLGPNANLPSKDDIVDGVNSSLVNWNGTAFLGLRLDQRGRRKANVLGVWGNMGFHTTDAVRRLVQTQGISTEVQAGGSNTFTEWEAGILFREWFRVSGGIGNQNFVDGAGRSQELSYYTATTSAHIPMGRSIALTVGNSFLFGRDFQEFSVRPSLGLTFRFNFFQI